MFKLPPSDSGAHLTLFPDVKLAYEAQFVPASSTECDVCVAIPRGNRRFFMWFRTIQSVPVLHFLEPTPAHSIRSVYQPSISPESIPHSPELWAGTIVSGYLVTPLVPNSITPVATPDPVPLFMVSDIHMFNAALFTPENGDTPLAKTGPLMRFFECYVPVERALQTSGSIVPTVRLCQWCGIPGGLTPENLERMSAMPVPVYPVKYMQLRASNAVAPHENIHIPIDPEEGEGPSGSPSSPWRVATAWIARAIGSGGGRGGAGDDATDRGHKRISDNTMRVFNQVCSNLTPLPSKMFKKIYHNHRAVFLVQADARIDVYKLFCVPNGANKHTWFKEAITSESPPGGKFYQYALVPTYRSSVYLNLLFRRVPSNDNLDYLEESDDEENEGAGVVPPNNDLRRKLLVECDFDWGRKRWVPHTLVPNDQVTRLVYEGEV